jgi:hypothetical protein
MDVRFCESQEPRREAQPRAEDSAICVLRAPPGAPGESSFLLTSTYHGCRLADHPTAISEMQTTRFVFNTFVTTLGSQP